MTYRLMTFTAAAMITMTYLACAGTAGKKLAMFSTMSSERPVEIVVLRNQNFVGSGLTRKVFLDGWIVATLGSGQYVRFYVAEGTHSIGTNQSSVSLDFVGGGDPYYFVISVDGGNWGASGAFEIERIESEIALRALDRYREIQ